MANAQLVNKGKIITVVDGSVMTIQGDAVNEGAIRNAGTIYLSGNWTNINSYLSQNGKFVFNGTTIQQIDHNGQTFYQLELDGGGTKVFDSDIEVVNELILISGIAEVSNSRSFLLREGATITGGSDASHIDGEVRVSGTGDLFFPIGANGNYAPVELLDVTGTSPILGMEVFEPNPASTPGFGVSEVSSVRYWQLELVTGSFTDAEVKLSLKDESIVSNINTAVVAQSNEVGGEFTSLGQSDNTGNGTDGTITSFDRATGTVFAIATELNEGRRSDSTALVFLYNTNGGTSWEDNTGWLEDGTPVDQWSGVTVNNTTGRVTQLNLADNRLTGELTPQIRLLEDLSVLNLAGNELEGAIPEQLNALTQLTTLDLSGNNITALPDLTLLSNLTSFDVRNNALQFPSIIPNQGIASIDFDPQDSLAETGGFFLFDRGQDFSLSVPEGASDDTYQWFLDDDPLENSNTRTYQILDLGRANMGDYRCEVSNPAVSDFTLKSKVTTVLATANISGALPVSDTDFLTAGDVKLLKLPEQTGPYDTISVLPINSTGQYVFEDVVLADYVIVAEPFDKETYLPTYHEQSISWDGANVILLQNDTTGIDINTEQVPRPLTPDDGNGRVGGEVSTDFDDDDEGGRIEARRKARRVGVALRRRRSSGRVDNEFEDFELIAYTQTDDEGQFQFENLPVGTYRIFIEYPGIPIDPTSFVEFTLGEDLDENELTVEATVFEDGIVVEKKEETGVPYDYLDELEIYPNPASDGDLFIKIGARRGYEVRFELVDLRGQVVKSALFNHQNFGSGVRKMDISDLSVGLYVIKVSVPSYQNQLFKVGKLIVRD
ncbi:MAG: T9SS type A sorting domain-containing protein [Bacteroidota bacterium]